MTKWNEELKKDLQKITMSASMKQKILYKQSVKEKSSNLMPIIVSTVLFAILFFALVNVNFIQLAGNKNASIAGSEFTELYVERDANSDITMHRSSLYTGIAKLDKQGIEQFQSYWNQKTTVSKVVDRFEERQFLAYTVNGEKIEGLISEAIDSNDVFLEVEKQIYIVPTTSANYLEELGIGSSAKFFILLFTTMYFIMLYFASFYGQKSKKNRVVTAIAIGVTYVLLMVNSNIPLLLLSVLMYIALSYIFRGERINKFKLLKSLQLIIIGIYFMLLIVAVSTNYKGDHTYIYTIVVLLVFNGLIDFILEKSEEPRCSYCKQNLSFSIVIKGIFISNSHCSHCHNKLLLNRKQLAIYTVVILLVLGLVAAIGIYYKISIGLLIIQSILYFVLFIAVLIGTEKKEEKALKIWD